MRLAGVVRVDDVVLVDDGLPYHALVLEPPSRQRVVVRPLYGPERSRRTVRAVDVVDHWHRSRAAATRAPREVAAA